MDPTCFVYADEVEGTRSSQGIVSKAPRFTRCKTSGFLLVAGEHARTARFNPRVRPFSSSWVNFVKTLAISLQRVRGRKNWRNYDWSELAKRPDT
jgi:hypothetical protein